MSEFSILLLILTVLFAYLIGAIPFGLIVARLFGIKDIRKLGSGNIGATNVWRNAGAKAAVWVFIGDIGKGILAVLIAKSVYKNYMVTEIQLELFIAICGIVAVLGHMFPVYLKFKGGKGVNTTLGVIATLLPLQTLMCFGVFTVILIITRYVSLASIIAVLALIAILLIQKFVLSQSVSFTYLIMALAMAFFVIIAHRQNIARIIAGTENKFRFSAGTSGIK